MLLLIVKLAHVLGAVLFLGTGAGSAYYKLRAFRSSDVRVVAWCDAEIVRADWWFTVPSGVLMPTTGAALVHLYAFPWSSPWILVGLIGYAIAGLTWLPAASLQIRMRRLSAQALADGTALPPAYASDQRRWMLLGIPSFTATLVVVWAMIAKWAFLP
jgi:uncharacterized membrane protein